MEVFLAAILILFLFENPVHSFRVLDSSGHVNKSAPYFALYQPFDFSKTETKPGPMDIGFVGYYGDPNTLQRERVNEGSFQSPDQEVLFEPQSPRQVCPGMIGPFSDGNYYCTAREYGYCDQRSGTCFCNIGYEGIDCSGCQPSHFRVGYLCYPKKLCPFDCNGAGTCNFWNGTCSCLPHRVGSACETQLCTTFDPLCVSCTASQCNLCDTGYYLTGNSSKVCSTCYDFDPRCAGCTKDSGCTVCADPLLTSVRRSGYRKSDPRLPLEENTRELSITIPFGSKSPEAFADAENYLVVSTADKPLSDSTISCAQGIRNDSSWDCSPFPSTYRVCGHKGVFKFSYPNYVVKETEKFLRLSVSRTGGGYGKVTITYFLAHYTTDDSDASATAYYTSDQQLNFDEGIVERSFLITILDDNIIEEDEVFQIVLQVPEGGGSVNAQFRANVTILDDDLTKFSAPLSRLSVNTTSARADSLFSISLQAVNAAGNAIAVGGERFIAFVENDDSFWDSYTQRQSLRTILTLSDFGTGVYQISGKIKEQGQYQMHIKHCFSGGLRGDYYADAYFQNLALTRIDRHVNFTWGTGRLMPRGRDYVSIRWTGAFKAMWPLTYFRVLADGHARLWVNGDLILDHWHEQEVFREPARAVNNLMVSALYEIVLEYRHVRQDAYITLLWGETTSTMGVVPSSSTFSLYNVGGTIFNPVIVNITSASSNPNMTECIGQGLFTGVVNSVSSFSVCPRDSYKNFRNDDDAFFLSSELFTAKLNFIPNSDYDGVGAEVLVPNRLYNSHSNCFDFSYTPQRAGSYQLDITYQTSPDASLQNVLGSPFLVNVFPTVAFGPYSRVYGLPSVLNAVAGRCYNFTIVSRDTSRNLLLKGGDNFDVYMYRVNFNSVKAGVLPPGGQPTLYPTASPTTKSQSLGLTPFSPASDTYDVVRYGTVYDLKNGNYSVQVCPVISGLYEVHILLNAFGVSNQPVRIMEKTLSKRAMDMGEGSYLGQYVASSPYSMSVVSASPNSKTSTAIGHGLLSAIVGVANSFMVTVRDSWDNVITNVATSVVTAKILQSPSAVVNIWNYNNGSMEIQYISEISGLNDVAVYVNGSHIRNSPFKVYFDPGRTSQMYSLVKGPGLKQGIAGVPSFFEVLAFDLENNRKMDDNDIFMYNISGVNSLSGKLLPCPVSGSYASIFTCDLFDGNLGHYYGIFTPTIRGSTVVNVYLSNKTLLANHVKYSPSVAYIHPTFPIAENTIVGGTLYDNIAGANAYVSLQTRDMFFNHLESGGFGVELAILCVANKWGTIDMLDYLSAPNIAALPNIFHYQGFFVGLPRYYGNCIDNLDGTYVCQYNIKQSGLYVLRLALEQPGLNATYFNDTHFGHLGDLNFDMKPRLNQLLGLPVNNGSTISWTGDIGGAGSPYGDRNFGSYNDKYKSRVERNINFDLSDVSDGPVAWENQTFAAFSNFDTISSIGMKNMKFREEYWSARWTGRITPNFAEEYIFTLNMDSNSYGRLYIGGVGFNINSTDDSSRLLVLSTNSSNKAQGTYYFSDIKPRDFTFEYIHRTGPAYASLSWQSASNHLEIIPADAFSHWRNVTHRNLTIHPTTLCPSCSTAYGAGLTIATVSQMQSFLVYARDAYGNLMQYGGDVPSMVAVGEDGVAFRGSITDYMNSTYLVEYEPVNSGNFLMYVTMGCCPPHPNVGISAEVSMMADLLIMGAPFKLHVSPAVMSVSRSVVTGAGAVGGLVGDILDFKVLFRDVYNNPTTDTRTFVYSNGSLGYPISESDIVVLFYKLNTENNSSPSDLWTPTYLRILLSESYASIFYAINRAGFYNMSISIKGSIVSGYPFSVDSTVVVSNLTPVLGSPSTITLYPAKADPKKTVCRGLGLHQASTNKSSNFEISLFDEFRNPLVTGGNKFYIRLVGDAKLPLDRPSTVLSRNSIVQNPTVLSSPVIPICTDNQNGKYFCTYQATFTGPHELHIYLLNYSTGSPGGQGLTGLYYTGPNSWSPKLNDVSSSDIVVKIDPLISFSWPSGFVLPTSSQFETLKKQVGQFIRWQGYILSPRSDVFSFKVDAPHFSTELYIDDVLVFDNNNFTSLQVNWVQGFIYKIYLEATVSPVDTNLPLSLELLWSSPISKWSVIPSFFLYDNATEIIFSPYPVSVS